MKLRSWLVTMVVAVGFGGAAAAVAQQEPEIQFVVGNAVWQPGKQYRDGADWLALSCTKAECAFKPASLSVRREKWQGHYDDRPTDGQKLTFKKGTPSADKTVAWFHAGNGAANWLVPGPVKTYASSASRFKRPDSEGTLELAVDLPDGGEARLVPMFNRSNERFLLQLRAQDRRQILGELASCSHEVAMNYLLWAGDMDADGRPDYLISLVDADGQVILFLSSLARANGLVGAAGTYDAPPSGGECDGAGWIERK